MTQLQTRAPTLQQEMAAWGQSYRAAQKTLADRAREAHHIRLRWLAAGHTGDFSAALAQAAGLSRTTAWRAWRVGLALEAGTDATADQTDLIEAARALDNGATAAEVNAAIHAGTVRDLANNLTVGRVNRQMTTEAADLRQQVQRRLGLLGLDHLAPEERDELVFAAFLQVPDSTLKRIVDSFRRVTEGGNYD